MATADHLKNLIKAYINHDDERFKTVVLQIAAYEAKHGHEVFARELKQYSDKIGGAKSNNILRLNTQNPMFFMTVPSEKLSDLVVSDEIQDRIKRILNEFKNRNKLQKFGLSNRRKILIEGKPGTGKTFTASVIASELNLPLYSIQLDKVVTKFMGETSAKLRQIFDAIASSTGVYFFDEFDAIGADRNLDNEVGEARRVLNSFLQFLEQDTSESIIIAATNNTKLLDHALFRRFDDVLHYSMPSKDEVRRLFELKILPFDKEFRVSAELVNKASTLNHAEIIRVCDDVIKISILENSQISEERLLNLIEERLVAYSFKEA
ncbi:MAG: ATPase [Firmicutes bacterium HGW-Firmicutes-9]|jgi:AAA+ superfamily predicted ATPase|nr:MAG: ATPase [Firmicutes bacterium HGW-Firmicutes-9]